MVIQEGMTLLASPAWPTVIVAVDFGFALPAALSVLMRALEEI